MAMIPVEVTLGDFATTIQVDGAEAERLGLVITAAPVSVPDPEPKARAARDKARAVPNK